VKPKTPEQLAKRNVKDKFTLYLSKQNMSEVKSLADKANISASSIVDEAITAYLAMLRDK
jgi:hypothetical protein